MGYETMTEPEKRDVQYVAFFVTSYESLDDAFAREPDLIAAHRARTKELHAQGKLLMAGAILNNPEEPLSTMAILPTREDAEEYARGDPLS